MKELHSTSANYGATFDETGKIFPMVELILVAAETIYSYVPDEVGTKVPTLSTIRFTTTPTILRSLAVTLVEMAAESEALMTGRAKE